MAGAEPTVVFSGSATPAAGYANGAAATARFRNPTGLSVDQPGGNLLVADTVCVPFGPTARSHT